MPDFPNAGAITIADLLRMRSGIPDAADEAFLREYWQNPMLPLDAEAMIARSAACTAEFSAPDAVTRYTNVNFMLLERIVEQVSGLDIRSFVAAHITSSASAPTPGTCRRPMPRSSSASTGWTWTTTASRSPPSR